MSLPRGYDAWRLSGPDDDRVEIGTEDGQPCNRFPEPDEDMPRGYRPRRCKGEMISRQEGAENFYTHWTECDTCGEIGEQHD